MKLWILGEFLKEFIEKCRKAFIVELLIKMKKIFWRITEGISEDIRNERNPCKQICGVVLKHIFLRTPVTNFRKSPLNIFCRDFWRIPNITEERKKNVKLTKVTNFFYIYETKKMRRRFIYLFIFLRRNFP